VEASLHYMGGGTAALLAAPLDGDSAGLRRRWVEDFLVFVVKLQKNKTRVHPL
jgi:hypothetical protein